MNQKHTREMCQEVVKWGQSEDSFKKCPASLNQNANIEPPFILAVMA